MNSAILMSACAVLAVALLSQAVAVQPADDSALLAIKGGALSVDDDWACYRRFLQRLAVKAAPRVLACVGIAALATPLVGPAALVAVPVCLWFQRLDIGGDAADILFQECGF